MKQRLLLRGQIRRLEIADDFLDELLAVEAAFRGLPFLFENDCRDRGMRFESERAAVTRGRVGGDQFTQAGAYRPGLSHDLLCKPRQVRVALGRKANMYQICGYSCPSFFIERMNSR